MKNTTNNKDTVKMNNIAKKVPPFEISKIIFILSCAWILLPIAVAIKETVASFTIHTEFLANMNQFSHYQDLFTILSAITLLTLLIYLARKSHNLVLSFQDVKKYFKKNIWMLFFFLFILWIIISAIKAPDQLIALAGSKYRDMGVFTYLIFTCLLFFPRFIRDKKTQNLILHLFILCADIVSIIMLLQELEIPQMVYGFGMVRSSVFIHFNHLGYYLNMATICVSGLIIFGKEQKKKTKIFETGSLILIFYTLLINDTMGGILSSLITTVVILWFYYLRNHKLSIKQFIPALIIVVLVLLSCLGLMPSSSGEDMSSNFKGLYEDANKLAEQEDMGSIGTLRFSLWAYYGKQIPDHPFFGLGPDQEPVGYEDHVISDRPANEYLYHAVFHGIPALIFYLAFLISLAVYQFKHIKELSDISIIAAGCVITYCISAFFGNTIFYTTCYFFLFLGFVLPSSSEK